MFASVRQKLIVLVAVVVGWAAWAWVAPLLLAADGSEGISLLSGRLSPVTATGVALLAGLPAIALGMVASVGGNPLAGVFAVATALCVLATRGGAMGGWLQRSDHLPGAYFLLILEVLVWQVGVVLLLALFRSVRAPARRRWPSLAQDGRTDTAFALRAPGPRSLVGGLICAAVAAAVASVLLRTAGSGQVIGALFVAFALGGVAAGLALPGCNPVGVLLSPALVAVAAYAWVLLSFGAQGQTELVAAYQQRQGAAGGGWYPTLAFALPIHYASSALAGCCVGVSIGTGGDHGAKRRRGARRKGESRGGEAADPSRGPTADPR